MRTGLRERKREQTRTALCRAAITLATESGGPEAVTVEAIADRANTSRRTFFNYFTAKEAAFVWPLYALAARFADTLGSRPDDEPVWDAVQHSLRAAVTAPDTDPALVVATDALVSASPSLAVAAEAHAVGEPTPKELYLRVKAEISRRAAADAGRDIYAQLVLEGAGMALRVAIRAWAHAGGDPLDHIDTAVRMLRHGIRPAA